MVNKKQTLFIISIVALIIAIFVLTYLQIIIWSTTLVIVLMVICFIVVIILIIWYLLSKRKKGVRIIGKDLDMDESMQIAKAFWSNRGIVMKFPSSYYCYGEERFDKGGNRFHGFAGIAYTRVKQYSSGKESVIEPINPHESKELGRCIAVVNATEKRVADWYIKPYQKQYEDLWKRLGIVSASREPEQIVKIKEVSPITGIEKESISGPVTAPEVQPTEVV